MALQVINSDRIGTGIQVDLGTDDDLYVAAGVVIAATDLAFAIFAYGVGQQIHVEGVVLSEDYCLAIAVDDSHCYLGETSILRNYGDTAVILEGGGHEIEMHGKVFAAFHGVFMHQGDGSQSTIINSSLINAGESGLYIATSDLVSIDNSGVITGGVDGILITDTGFLSGTGDVEITNSGTIKGGANGIEDTGTGVLTIENSGLIRNGVILGNLSDSYDGRLGRITGAILGGDGDDTILGGAGVERIEGDTGADHLNGGLGADLFLYVALTDSTTSTDGADVITGFSHKQGDIIDLSAIDGDSIQGGIQDFRFVGTGKLTKAGEEISYQVGATSTFIFINTDHDNNAEMMIELSGKLHLFANDFAL